MSLLQKTLDRIEAKADKESAMAVANADLIREMETLAEMLRADGESYFIEWPYFHTHMEINDPKAIVARVSVYAHHADAIRALDRSGLSYTMEIENDPPTTMLRVDGMTAFIELMDYTPTMSKAA